MKKTFTINISGIIFHIDEDAYSKLNSYLSSIKVHFNNLDGKEEVISDIESRIAEILQSKLSDTKQVVVLEDINEVIEIMGQPSDFSDEEEEPIRQNTYNHKQSGYKRLYRDPENKMIGGVASGIGAYLNVDPIWVRIIFIISLFTTLGAFIYIILWIAVPEALTTSDRLEMKGEPVNISNIEKSIKDEFDHLKGKINDLTQQAKETYKKKSDIPKTFFEDILELFINIVKIFFKGIVILLGIVIIITGLSLVLAFIAAFFGHGIWFFNEPDVVILPAFELMDLFLSSSGNIGLLKVGLFFLIGVPLIMLIYAGIRMIFGFEKTRHLGLTAFILWLMGLAITITFSFKIFHNFRYEVEDKEEYAIEQVMDNEVFLQTRDKYENSYYKYDDYIEIDDLEIAIAKDGYYINQARLEIRKSNTDKISLVKYSSARGRSGFHAKERAEMTEYHFEQDGNHFIFDEFYKIPEGEIWADQKIWLELRVPVGTKVHLDKEMYNILKRNSRYYYYSWSDRDYFMTEDGLEKLRRVKEKVKDTIKKGYSGLNSITTNFTGWTFGLLIK
jgi:phage shock protein PspC (stress-responsive transcriptional regulator)